jgi:hypothetical protein
VAARIIVQLDVQIAFLKSSSQQGAVLMGKAIGRKGVALVLFIILK